ncbi:hypothetical protein ACFOG5_05270 [Pedobacter fastidiosus]
MKAEEFYGRTQLEINFHESQKLQNLTITEKSKLQRLDALKCNYGCF